MDRKIIWTTNARDDFRQVVEYLSNEWSEKVAVEFIKIFYAKIKLISTLPQIGVEVNYKENVRRILITKHNVLYYLFNDKELVLLDLFDTRQNPSKNVFN
jgi:plasmid stabilization system protein ParE